MSTEPSRPAPEPEDRQSLGLVVERKTGESVVIGDEIEIKLVSVIGDRARIGVLAPQGVTVVRGKKPLAGTTCQPTGATRPTAC